MIDTDRPELHQRLADGLAAQLQNARYLEKYHDEGEISAETQKNYGAISDMHELARSFVYFSFSEAEPEQPLINYWPEAEELDTPGFALHLSHHVYWAAARSKWSDTVHEMGKGLDAGYHPDLDAAFSYAALSDCRKRLAKSNDPLHILIAATIFASTAAYYRPDDVHNPSRPRRHKHETTEHLLYRNSVRNLHEVEQRLLSDPDLKLYRQYLAARPENGDELSDAVMDVLHTPGESTERLRKGHAADRVLNRVEKLAKFVTDPDFRSADFHTDLLRARQDFQREHAEPDVDVEETVWTILPPGTMEEIERTGNGNGGEVKTFVDPNRMKWLARLALSWGPDGYIAVANLDAAGNYDYRVAVLPQILEDGTVLEHAIAENPASGNALYAFRGETGHDPRDGIWLSWKEVFAETKRHARTLGSRRMLHGMHYEENVLEYLTRPTSELDRRDYRR